MPIHHHADANPARDAGGRETHSRRWLSLFTAAVPCLVVPCLAVALSGCQSLSFRPPAVDAQPAASPTSPATSPQNSSASSLPDRLSAVHAAPHHARPQPRDARPVAVRRPTGPIAQVAFDQRAGAEPVHVGDDCSPTATAPGFGNHPIGAACPSGAACGGCRGCMTRPHGYAMPAGTPPWRLDPQEFLCDGGDHPPRARLAGNGQILALQPEDTVSHYTTATGEVEFTASNRVCVYAPRFGVVRQIRGAVAGEKAVTAIGVERPVGPIGIDINQPGLVVADSTELVTSELTRRVDSMRERNRGVPIENVQQPLQAEDVLAALAGIVNRGPAQLDEAQLALIQEHAAAALAWTIDESVEVAIEDLAAPVLTRDQQVDSLVVYEFPDGRLNLIKMADRQHAAIGETVSFLLRLQNVGDSAVSGVVVTDNLTTRLAYVEDSQTSSVPADFETKLNSAGSEQLIWTLREPLPVGESVLLEFECRVR